MAADQRPRRLDWTAIITGVPLVALIVAEFVTWLDGRPGGTVSETVWCALGDPDSPARYFLGGTSFGWRQLIVLVLAGAVTGAGLYLAR